MHLYSQTTLPSFVSKKDTFALPDRIGPYKVDSLLHQGSMSLLLLGANTRKEPIALKVLLPTLLSDKELCKQFLREAEIISLADHPNIVKLYGQGEWQHGLYIAMEFIQGISLHQFILQRSFSIERSLEIIQEIGYALLHLHTHGIIHRDLKPENVLITEKGHVKLIDFGIAHILEEKRAKMPGRIIGTPSYMSPEQRKDPYHITFTSDIYSLGIILYELLTGKLSFGHIQLDLIPKHLHPILKKALAPSPADRYQDIVDLISDIADYRNTDHSQEDHFLELSHLIQTEFPLPPLPSWPDLDIALTNTLPLVYYDFFHLEDNSYAFILTDPYELTLRNALQLATFKGHLHALLKGPFIATDLAAKLPLPATILHLSPLLDRHVFISNTYHLNTSHPAWQAGDTLLLTTQKQSNPKSHLAPKALAPLFPPFALAITRIT